MTLQPFVPHNPLSISPSHSISSITSKTRFGDGQIKTIAKGNINIKNDIIEINAGKAFLNQQGDIVTSSGRIYGRHPDRDTIFLRSRSLGSVDLTKAEFNILREMIKKGGLRGSALRAFEGMRKARNKGLSGDSQQKLIDLFNSK